MWVIPFPRGSAPPGLPFLKHFVQRLFLGGTFSFKTGCRSAVTVSNMVLTLAKLRILLDYALQKRGFVPKPGDFANRSIMFFPLVGQHGDHSGHRPAGTCWCAVLQWQHVQLKLTDHEIELHQASAPGCNIKLSSLRGSWNLSLCRLESHSIPAWNSCIQHTKYRFWCVGVALSSHKAWAKQMSKALGCRSNGRKDNVEKIAISLDNCITWMCLEYSVQTCV